MQYMYVNVFKNHSSSNRLLERKIKNTEYMLKFGFGFARDLIFISTLLRRKIRRNAIFLWRTLQFFAIPCDFSTCRFELKPWQRCTFCIPRRNYFHVQNFSGIFTSHFLSFHIEIKFHFLHFDSLRFRNFLDTLF